MQRCTLAMSRHKAEQLLIERIKFGNTLLKSAKTTIGLNALKENFNIWTLENESILSELYTCNDYLESYKAWYGKISRLRVWSESEEIAVTVNELEYKLDVLEECLESLELIPERDTTTPYELEDYYD